MTIDVKTIEPGLRIPLWTREGTFYHWNRFHAVNSDFAGHHMDDEIGRHEGFASVFISAPFCTRTCMRCCANGCPTTVVS